MKETSHAGRSLGLLGATGVGVGAIVGGGILALAGVAYAITGPGAVVAFALNGLIALLTVFSFAEMSTTFPESGGSYTFARKVLTIQAAFAVGWVVWFASIVAAVLYALGFAAYGLVVLDQLWQVVFGASPDWLAGRSTVTLLALAATAVYTFSLFYSRTGGGQWVTLGKIIVFAVLICGGVWALSTRPLTAVPSNLSPFFPGGAAGLFQAMGYTFIALQGYDLIAAVAGEVRDPKRTLPRAMLWSLAIALAIYLPLLFIIAAVGAPPGESVAAMSAENPETFMALAAQNFLGPAGFWLMIIAAILSMLSALYVNLLAASRVALAMARDRTLPHFLDRVSPSRGTPTAAIAVSTGLVAIILLVTPDVAAAGAAASLIFLISFALAHWTCILTRWRHGAGLRETTFQTPWFPLLPVVGAVACISLAVFQGFTVPAAGLTTSFWLVLGGMLFLFLFGDRARVVDAAAEATDPQLVRLRGRSPLVLVPIANPANAAAMVGVANALTPPGVGRVLLLSVVAAPESWRAGESPPQLLDAEAVLRESLVASFSAGLSLEALITVAPLPWSEIGRVARAHRCESLLLGSSDVEEELMGTQIEALISSVDCDVSILRAGPGWELSQVRRVLVPVGGSGTHDRLRAHFLGSLCRTGDREVSFLRVLRKRATQEARTRAKRELARLAGDKLPGHSRIEVVLSDEIAREVVDRAANSDLVILGLQRFGRRHKGFGEVSIQIARNTDCAVVMISQQG